MKCVIIDDEPLARQGMVLNCEKISSLELTKQFSNALEANEYLQNNNVDLMFLDIQMPEMTGLDFLKMLKDAPMVILTTAYPEYALESYELDVIDYLVKPIQFDKFVRAVNKAQELFLLKQNQAGKPISIQDDFIFIKSERIFVKVFFSEIRYIEGLKDYVIIHTETEKHLTAMNVKTILKQLPEEIFVRVNKSFIINVNHIKTIDSDFITVEDKDIPIGRIYKEHFMENFVIKKLLKR